METRVAFFDNQPIRLKGFSVELGGCADVEIVGFGNSIDALESFVSAGQYENCVILLGGSIIGEDYSIIRQYVQRVGQAKIILMTSSTQVGNAVKVLEAGAAGYVLSTSTGEQVIDAIKCVSRGEVFITHSLAMAVINAMRLASMASRKPSPTRLSIREEQILKLLLCGQTNKEIGKRLAISEKTVKHYMTALMQKMNARNRTEVVLAAQASQANQTASSRDWMS